MITILTLLLICTAIVLLVALPATGVIDRQLFLGSSGAGKPGPSLLAAEGSATSTAPAPRTPAAAAAAAAAKPAAAAAAAAMAFNYRAPIVARATGKHTATVIMLHGLGDDGSGWSAIADEMQPKGLSHVKFVFPHAPARPITVNMGMRMPGWFDISSLDDIDQKEDAAGLRESARYVDSLVAAEAAAGVPSDRVVVAGFSQGGAIALMALRGERKLAGVVGLSTWLPLRKEPGTVSAANARTPVFQAHGDADGVVSYQFGVATHERLEELGVPAEFKTYRGMGHSAAPAELAAVADFLKRVLPPT